MATKIGPKTVTQRDRSKALVFCVDAAHPDSYAGQPATNLLPSDISHANWTAYNTKNVTTLTNGGLDGKSDAYILTDNHGSQYQGVQISLGGTGAGSALATSTLHTFSVWVKQKTTSEDTNRTHFRWYEGGGGGGYMSLRIRSGAADGPVVDSGRSDADDPSTTGTTGIWETARDKNGNLWFRAYYTWTTKSSMSGTQTMQLLPAHDGATSSGSSANTGSETIWCPQLEVGDCPTPAVGPGLSTTTARSASTAVKNISGLGALGTTLTGTFATYGNKLRSKVGSRKVNRGTIAAGNIGGAYWDLAGDDECIVIPYADDSSLDLARGTIIAWFRASGGGHNGTIVGWGSAGTNNYGNIAITSNWTGGYADESLAYNRYKGSASNIQMYIRKGENFYADSTWHCVAVTSHGGTSDLGRIYIDGELQTITTGSSIGDEHPFMNIRDGEAKFLNIGRRPYNGGDAHFNGEIANTMIWSSSLTSKEIKDIYIAQKGRFGK